jgi:hypothetical protein
MGHNRGAPGSGLLTSGAAGFAGFGLLAPGCGAQGGPDASDVFNASAQFKTTAMERAVSAS